VRGRGQGRTGEERRTRILVCAPNWIGDTIMAMPAVQALRRREPHAVIALLVKPHIAPLWRMHAAPNVVLPLEPGIGGILQAARRLRRERFDWAFVLPHSVRSALPPWLARIPRRAGSPGTLRTLLLHTVVHSFPASHRAHQAYENLDLLAPAEAAGPIEPPRLVFGEDRVDQVLGAFEWETQRTVGLIPGAARGPSKRWPASAYTELGRTLRGEGCQIALFGAPGEVELCTRIAEGIGEGALNLAGRTTLEEWAILLSACRMVVANDSGGMHIAAATGTPVIALFGLTDPRKTGPIGPACEVIQPAVTGSRDIARDSAAARNVLASISVDEVHAACRRLLAGSDPASLS